MKKDLMIGGNVIEKDDKIVQMLLLNSHEADHLYRKKNGTYYWCHHRKSGDTFSIPEIQMEMFPSEPPKSNPLTEEQIARAPHLNMLEKYYGEDWKPEPVEGLEDHY